MNNNINDDDDDGDDNSIIAVERDFTFLSLNPVARKKGWCFVRCLEKKLYEKSNKKRKQKSLFLLFSSNTGTVAAIAKKRGTRTSEFGSKA